MGEKELSLGCLSCLDVLLAIDIFLTPVNDPNVASPQGQELVLQDIFRVSSLVHQVKFSQNSNGPQTFRIRLPGQVEGVAGGYVRVGRGDGQDETGVPADVSHDHVLDLVPDVSWLVTHSDLGQTRQVDECNVEY